MALSSDDDTRLQTFDRVATYLYGTNEFKLCEDEMVNVCKAKYTFKILSKDCENDLCVTCNIFLNYMKRKCANEVCKICLEKNGRYKWLILMIMLMKIKPNIMKSGCILQISHTEY